MHDAWIVSAREAHVPLARPDVLGEFLPFRRVRRSRHGQRGQGCTDHGHDGAQPRSCHEPSPARRYPESPTYPGGSGEDRCRPTRSASRPRTCTGRRCHHGDGGPLNALRRTRLHCGSAAGTATRTPGPVRRVDLAAHPPETGEVPGPDARRVLPVVAHAPAQGRSSRASRHDERPDQPDDAEGQDGAAQPRTFRRARPRVPACYRRGPPKLHAESPPAPQPAGTHTAGHRRRRAAPEALIGSRGRATPPVRGRG